MSDERVAKIPALHGPETTLASRASVVRRFNALFRAMGSDFLLREQFVTDPAQIVSEYVHGTRLSASSASIANHLLYSMLANPKLRTWLSSYGHQHGGELPPRSQLLSDLGRAMAKAGDDHITFGLIRSAVERDGFEAFEWMLTALVAVLRLQGAQSPTGGPPTGGPPTGGPPTGGPPTGGPPTGGPPTGGPPTGGPPTGGPPTDDSIFGHLPDYLQRSIDELSRYAVHLRDIGALDIFELRTSVRDTP